MKGSQVNIEEANEQAIDDLIDQLRLELRDLWERHGMSVEYVEDELPEVRRKNISADILSRARLDLSRKTIQEVGQMTSDSIRANSRRASMIEHYLNHAVDAIQDYYDEAVYNA